MDEKQENIKEVTAMNKWYFSEIFARLFFVVLGLIAILYGHFGDNSDCFWGGIFVCAMSVMPVTGNSFNP